MRRNSIFKSNRLQRVAQYLLVNLAGALILAGAQPTLAETQQRTFTSAEQAAQSLYDAVRSQNKQAVEVILGAPGLDSTGDTNQDKLEHERFAQKYQEMHRLVREADGSTVLYIGAENWPFPIPLLASDGKWHFDSDSGSQEIIAREIGENESIATEVCQTASKAAVSNASKASDDEASVREFAQHLRSENDSSNSGVIFHGYRFRVLKKPGDTVVVAYPVDYGTTGVLTFVATGNVVYERDLGQQTATEADRLQGKPAGAWTRVQ